MKNWTMLLALTVLGTVLISFHSFAAVDSVTAVGVWLFDNGDVSDSSGTGQRLSMAVNGEWRSALMGTMTMPMWRTQPV